jgi:hypothetical protein
MEDFMRIRTSLALGLLLVLTAAGCARGTGGDDGVASAGEGKATPSATASAGGGKRDPQADQEAFLKYAQCMRDHGVPMEDPQMEGGGVNMMVPEGTDKSKVDAANAECKSLMPNGGEPQKLDPATQEKLRKFSQCMRDNGIASFPDPSEDGGIQIKGDPGTDLDPGSERFKAAQKACEQYQPKPGGGGEGDDGGSHVTGGGA